MDKISVMLCAGVCEQAVSQWASALAERDLGISKALGDIAGPMLFALLMGTVRVLYGLRVVYKQLGKTLLQSGVLCAVSYGIIALSPWPAVSLLGCGICGLSVGVLWPATLSMASHSFPKGGTTLFALLALGGDLGCSLDPAVVGKVAGWSGQSLRHGILAAAVFPLGMTVILAVRQLKACAKSADAHFKRIKR